MERITKNHIFFWGGDFSNWAALPVEYMDREFPTAEHAYMYAKAMFFEDHDIASTILGNEKMNLYEEMVPLTPKDVKELGRKVKGYDDTQWEAVRYNIMVGIQYAKFNRTEHLRELLIMTYPKIIVEASPYDQIWGIGLHWTDQKVLDEENWRGRNLLGKAMMKVRKMLMDESGRPVDKDLDRINM